MRSVILAMLVVVSTPAALAAQEPVSPLVPSIVTTGEAVVRRAPDQAFVTAAVETRARAPRDAQRQNAETMTAVQGALAAAGFSRDAMRTLGYAIHQEFDYVNGRQVPRGYVARNAIEVRVDAIERTGEALDVAVQAGATSIAGVKFDLKDRAAVEREALRLAVVDASARADAAAEGVGRAVARVLRIDDRPASPPPRPMMLEAARDAAAVAPRTPVEPGELEIRAEVVLTVEIR
jgi:uncharacterized protein YggE